MASSSLPIPSAKPPGLQGFAGMTGSNSPLAAEQGAIAESIGGTSPSLATYQSQLQSASLQNPQSLNSFTPNQEKSPKGASGFARLRGRIPPQ